MSLTSRVLPVNEWGKLEGTALGSVRATLPDNTTVIVVERDGRLVACWAGMGLTHYHVEGLEIVPDERGNTSVARRLLMGMREHVASLGVPAVFTGSQTAEVSRMLESAGASPAEMTLYVLPMKDGV
jgi:hypothetical protein